MDEYYNKHYITVDDAGRILSGWSDGPHPDRDTAGSVLLTDKGGYQFRLFPGGEENPCLYTMDGIPRYRWDGTQAVERTEDEMEADRAARPAPPPTTDERITILEEQLVQADETSIALYEAQEAQETINAQQDESLMELYEMIG